MQHFAISETQLLTVNLS